MKQKHSLNKAFAHGASVPVYYFIINSPLGPLTLVGTRTGLNQLLINVSEKKFLLQIRYTNRLYQKRDIYFKKITADLKKYFDGSAVEFSSPLDLFGSSFQKKVWKICSGISYGQVKPYSWISKQLGPAQSARAVGNALASNQIPIIIPCHRVIRKNGSLGGYTGGLRIKKKLLEIEQARA